MKHAILIALVAAQRCAEEQLDGGILIDTLAPHQTRGKNAPVIISDLTIMLYFCRRFVLQRLMLMPEWLVLRPTGGCWLHRDHMQVMLVGMCGVGGAGAFG